MEPAVIHRSIESLSTAMLAQGHVSSLNMVQHLIEDGGYVAWLLIGLSVVSVFLIIRFMIGLRRSLFLPTTLNRALLAAARQGQTRSILEITQEDTSMLAQAALAGVSQLPAGRGLARTAIDEAVEERTTRLFRRIEYLNVIGNISPMIGLFGTVLGMIQAFARIDAAGGGMPDAGELAGDISIALVTTFWGLLVAIPALTAFALFRNRVDAFAAECVKSADGMIALIANAGTAAPADATAEPRRPSNEAVIGS